MRKGRQEGGMEDRRAEFIAVFYYFFRLEAKSIAAAGKSEEENRWIYSNGNRLDPLARTSGKEE